MRSSAGSASSRRPGRRRARRSPLAHAARRRSSRACGSAWGRSSTALGRASSRASSARARGRSPSGALAARAVSAELDRRLRQPRVAAGAARRRSTAWSASGSSTTSAMRCAGRSPSPSAATATRRSAGGSSATGSPGDRREAAAPAARAASALGSSWRRAGAGPERLASSPGRGFGEDAVEEALGEVLRTRLSADRLQELHPTFSLHTGFSEFPKPSILYVRASEASRTTPSERADTAQ